MSLLEPLEQPIFSIRDWFCEVAGESPLSGVALTPQTAEPRIRPTVRGSSAFFIIMSPLERETLIGRLRSIPKDEGLQPVYSEYNFGPYRRSFRISGMIDQDKITAELSDGVITLVLPKAERAQPRRIAIG